jgi:hypothetical protein
MPVEDYIDLATPCKRSVHLSKWLGLTTRSFRVGRSSYLGSSRLSSVSEAYVEDSREVFPIHYIPAATKGLQDQPTCETWSLSARYRGTDELSTPLEDSGSE